MILYAAASPVAISLGELSPAGFLPDWSSFLMALIMASHGLMTAVIIVGAILSGLFTPTKTLAVAVICTVIISALVYRTRGASRFLAAGAVKTGARTMLIMAARQCSAGCSHVSKCRASSRAGSAASPAHPIVVVLAIALLLRLLGAFMDMAPRS